MSPFSGVGGELNFARVAHIIENDTLIIQQQRVFPGAVSVTLDNPHTSL